MSKSVLNPGEGRLPADWSEWTDVDGNKYRKTFGNDGFGRFHWYTEYSYNYMNGRFRAGEGNGRRPLTCTKKLSKKERKEIEDHFKARMARNSVRVIKSSDLDFLLKLNNIKRENT